MREIVSGRACAWRSRIWRGRLAAAVGAVAGALLGLSPARATDYSWKDPVSGNWNDPARWGAAWYPQSSADNVTIGANGTYTVTRDSGVTIGNFSLSAPGATLTSWYSFTAASFLNAGTFQSYNPSSEFDLTSSLINNSGTLTLSAYTAKVTGALSNSGTVNVRANTTLDGDVTNSGNVTIDQYQSLSMNVHSFTQTAGTLRNNGTMTISGGSFVLNGGSTIANLVQLQNSGLTFGGGVGGFALGGTSTLSGDITAGSLVVVADKASVTAGASFANNGTLAFHPSTGYLSGVTMSVAGGSGTLTNNGALTSDVGLSRINGHLTNNGSITGTGRLSMDASVNSGTITLSAGYQEIGLFVANATRTQTLSNSGTINLAIGGATWFNADLDNSGTVHFSNGSYGRAVSAIGDWTNRPTGTLDLSANVTLDLGLSLFPASLANSGSITTAAGCVFKLSHGAAFTQNAGAISGAGGMKISAGSVMNYNGGTISAPVVIDTATLNWGVAAPAAAFLFQGNGGTLNGNIPAGGSVAVEALTEQTSAPTYTLGSMTNSGSLSLQRSTAGTNADSVWNIGGGSGTLTNNGTMSFDNGRTATINGNLVNNGSLTLNTPVVPQGDWTNNGTMTVQLPFGLSTFAPRKSFTQSGGTLNNQSPGTTNSGFRMASGSTFSYTGGSITGTIALDDATLSFGAGAGTGTFEFVRQAGTLAGDIPAGATVRTRLNFYTASPTITAGSSFANNGTLAIMPSTMGYGNYTVVQIAGGSGTLTNTGTLNVPSANPFVQVDFRAGLINSGNVMLDWQSNGQAWTNFFGNVTNSGLFVVDMGHTASMAAPQTRFDHTGGSLQVYGTLNAPTFNWTGGTITGTGSAKIITLNYSGGSSTSGSVKVSGALNFAPGTGGTPSISLTGSSQTMSGDIPVGATVNVAGSTASALAVSAGSFTNYGTLAFSAPTFSTYGCTLSVDGGAGTLTNPGSIVSQGNSWSRTIQGSIASSGSIAVTAADLDITGDLSSSGDVALSAGRRLSAARYTQSAGALHLANALSTLVATTIAIDGGSVDGCGVLNGAVTLSNGGTLAPGPGQMAFTVTGDLTVGDGGMISVDVSSSGSTMDLIASANLDLSSGHDWLVISGVVPTADSVILTWIGALTGTFDHVTPGYSVRYDLDAKRIEVAAVPEPASLTLLALAGLGLLRRRAGRPSRIG